jgi:site-specific recombinase XerD
MTLDDYIDRFREHLEITHASPRTVETYCGCARTFVAFLRRSYPRTTGFQRVSRDVALDYQRYLQNRKNRSGRPLSTRSHAAYIKALRKLFAFLLSESVVLHNPFASLTMPREGRPLPRNILSQEEVVELLRNMKARDPVGIRNRAIVELFYACGMRTSELCSLLVGDVDLQDQTAIIVHGKGDKTRIVPIGQYASYFVGEYLVRGRRHMLRGTKEDPGFLFLSQRGNRFDRSTLNKCVLPKHKGISGYTFRHSLASHLLANDVDVTYIAKLLGHESLRTTQRYLRLEIGDLKRMHGLYHPRERTQRPETTVVPGANGPAATRPDAGSPRE